MQKTEKATQQLQILLDRFQHKLSLTDWYVEAVFVSRESFIDLTEEANIIYNLDRKEAFIKIVREEDRANTVFNQKVTTEELLLHELLHLHITSSFETQTAQEKAINMIVKAILHKG